MAENLMSGLLEEMNRVRELIKEYEHPIMKGAGFLGASMMKIGIQNAERAISSGDVVQMLVCYDALKKNTG